MLAGASAAILSLLLLLRGCSLEEKPVELKYKATGNTPELLAVYEGWFGLPKHIKIDYTSHDPEVMRTQIRKAKELGISGFVVDWYGDREPYIDQSYALLQGVAARNNFHVAMMYEEADLAEGATDAVMADFTMFHETYLSEKAPGRQAYLTYQGRPVIFVFPNGNHTDWAKIRTMVNKWNPAPFLIQENLPGPHPEAFDGFYAWINPGGKGWTADGNNWGESYLADFYHTMATKYPNSIVVGGAWPKLDDSKASWGLNRHMSARCGQTYRDTVDLWRKHFPAGQTIPFLLIETWNDYEEGSSIETGVPTCGDQPAPPSDKANPGSASGLPKNSQAKP